MLAVGKTGHEKNPNRMYCTMGCKPNLVHVYFLWFCNLVPAKFTWVQLVLALSAALH